MGAGSGPAKVKKRPAPQEQATDEAPPVTEAGGGKKRKRHSTEEEAPAEAAPAPAAAPRSKDKGAVKLKARGAKAKGKLDLKKARERRNKALQAKGLQTKKERYLAAKAAKKADEADAKKRPFKLGGTRLEAEALAAAGLEKLDPRVTECFVKGLPYTVTEQHVQNHFKDIAPCTVQLLMDEATGRPRGTAFLTFTLAEHALKACTLTNTRIHGRWIHVRLCELRGAKAVGSEAATASRSRAEPSAEAEKRPEGCLTAVVRCDKTAVTEEDLWTFFEDCHVTGMSCISDKSGQFRGLAFLDFEDGDMVDAAVQKNGQAINGATLAVRYKFEGKSQ